MTDEERAIDVAAATPRVTAILHPNAADPAAPKPPRAPRSDKGTHRPAKAEQPAGKLSREQIDILEGLIEEREEAARVYLAAQKAYGAFLEQITANTER
jgi:hypothetical protein